MRDEGVKDDETSRSDLGFGSAGSHEEHIRLINRDGSYNVRRRGLSFLTSLSVYHALLTMTWTRFLGLALFGFLALNGLFAIIYVGVGAELGSVIDGTLLDKLKSAFFFSVQTSTTIGYGHLRPVGTMSNVLVTVESFFGLLGFAIVTGLLFARFSRPVTRILFSDFAIVAPYRGITGFQFRILNGRTSQLYNVKAKLSFSRNETVDGVTMQRFHRLPLEIDRVSFFPLAWTIVHPIDRDSPLYQETHESLEQSNAEFLISLSAVDETFHQAVHTRGSYVAGEMRFGVRFASLYDDPQPSEPLTVDVAKLSQVESAPLD